MADTQYGKLALIPAIALGLYFLLRHYRFGKFTHIPSPLKRNLFIGHLGYIAGEYKNLESSAVHADYVFENIWKKNGSPGWMFLDFRPIEHPIVLVCSHEVAEQVSKSTKTQPYSVTKSPTLQGGFRRIIGKESLLSHNGETWKGLRKRFNPGFAPQHILSLLPVVIEKTYILMDKLDALAKSGVATAIEPFCTNVTFDIISEVITNLDCKAQEGDVQGSEIVKLFRQLVPTYIGDNALVPSFLNIPLHLKRYTISNRLDAAVKNCISEKFQELQSHETKGKQDRSVLALALKDIDELTPAISQSIADQVKTFLFAGYDTTSVLLQRLFYVLSIHPRCLAKIRAEHDAVFGDSDPKEVFLARPDETIKALVYTSACIKEALRLWPPAGSARMSHNGFKIRDSDGQEVCIDECVIYICHHIIQRDRKVYGDTVDDFVPERWVGDSDTSSGMTDQEGTSTGASNIPISAWRPFERGPRNCIGQELANLEARIILACVMRRYDFVKVGRGEAETDEKGQPIIDEKGRYKLKSELLSTIAITAKPIDKTVMRVELR